MKSIPILILAACAATLALNDIAEARRMGGGGNYGAQRSVTPQRATPSQSAPTSPTNNAATPPSQPVQPGAPASANAPKAAPQPAPSGMSRWLGPIAGIAAGLGLAALMSHLGLSEGFGTLLLLALLVVGGVFLVRMLFRRAQMTSPPQYSGYSGTATGSAAATPDPYASVPAAPAWRIPSSSELDVSAPSGTQPAPAFGVTRNPLPAGFDAAGFAREAKRQYIELQHAYDIGDRSALANFMTAEMATEIGRDLDTRGAHQATEIVALNAEVLDVSTEGEQHWVSVRFAGLVREDGDPAPHPIDEVWNLSKPVNGGSGWLLAGISQLA
jgi:predicted lipid-binding transport protein (Tim44 family)